MDHPKEAIIEKNFFMHHELKNDAIKTANNIIFVISTGTFVVSITFIGQVDSLVKAWLIIL